MRNYYVQIHEYMEKLIRNVIIMDKRGIKANGISLSITELLVLRLLGDGKDKRMSEVMDTLNLDRNTFKTMVSRLQSQGYILKEKFEDDKRAYLLKLTEKGKNTFEEIMTTEKKMLFTLLNDFTFNEEKAILKFLVKLDMLPKGEE